MGSEMCIRDRAEASRTRAEALDTQSAWACYVIAAAEAERARRIAVNDELDWANQLERERRQKWAAEAAQREQRRRIREGFARETQGTRWFEGLIERKNEDYEVACPYAAFGCRHCGPRSTISLHLCGNQPVSRVHLAESIGERPHRHAVVLTSRRWRGGHDSAVAETRRNNLISTQVNIWRRAPRGPTR